MRLGLVRSALAVWALAFFFVLADSVSWVNVRAVGTTWYFDNTAGVDAHDCHTDRTQACKSWTKFISLFNAGTIAAGDTVLFRPGRYQTNPSGGLSSIQMTAAGGTSGAHITVSVDTFYSGNVEIDGALAPGPTTVNGVTVGNFTNWAQARKCSGGTKNGVDATNTVCDTDADCTDGTTTTISGTLCSDVTGVFYTRASNNHGDTGGNTPGYAFQPGANVGDSPKFFTVLFSPPQTPIVMPTFASDTVWSYTEKAAVCRATGVPWTCCTASGVGATCGSTTGSVNRDQRVYVKTAAGTRPDLQSPPVEIPFGGFSHLWVNGSSPTKFVDFTNNSNGRQFYWWHTQKSLVVLQNATDFLFRNINFAYQGYITPSKILSRNAWTDSGSAWPRNNGGSAYLIQSGVVKNERNNTFKDLDVGYSCGDENIHLTFGTQVETGACNTSPTCSGGVCSNNAAVSCNVNRECLGAECTATSNGIGGVCDTDTSLCHYSPTGGDLFENVNIHDAAWATLNDTQPNSATAACHWAPSNYSGWGSAYTYCSALGGGGQSGNCAIIQSPKNIFRNVTMSNCTGLSWENPNENTTSGFNYGNLIENSTFDGTRLKVSADATASTHPATPVAACDGGPGGVCGGFSGGNVGIIWNPTFSFSGCPGNVIRNSLIKNGYGFPLAPGFKNNILSRATQRPNAILNCTIELKGNSDYDTVGGELKLAKGFGGTAGCRGVFKNNIIVYTGSSAPTNHVEVQATEISSLDIDNNDWGPGIIWRWNTDGNGTGGTLTSTFGPVGTANTWQNLTNAATAGNESHAQQADPLLDANYLIANGSPAKDAGTSLATTFGFSTDSVGTSRPQGSAWDEGWFEVVVSGPTTTSSSTSSTSTSSTTSTSIFPKAMQGVSGKGWIIL